MVATSEPLEPRRGAGARSVPPPRLGRPRPADRGIRRAFRTPPRADGGGNGMSGSAVLHQAAGAFPSGGAGMTLIEASAGTGKTRELTGIVARLVVEEGRRIEEILVVTFTRAATAELRDRIPAHPPVRSSSGRGRGGPGSLPGGGAPRRLERGCRIRSGGGGTPPRDGPPGHRSGKRSHDSWILPAGALRSRLRRRFPVRVRGDRG